jgi:hypothetical protein
MANPPPPRDHKLKSSRRFFSNLRQYSLVSVCLRL